MHESHPRVCSSVGKSLISSTGDLWYFSRKMNSGSSWRDASVDRESAYVGGKLFATSLVARKKRIALFLLSCEPYRTDSFMIGEYFFLGRIF
jgi:hypothetical protein